jgi:hypothetical protein
VHFVNYDIFLGGANCLGRTTFRCKCRPTEWRPKVESGEVVGATVKSRGTQQVLCVRVRNSRYLDNCRPPQTTHTFMSVYDLTRYTHTPSSSTNNAVPMRTPMVLFPAAIAPTTILNQPPMSYSRGVARSKAQKYRLGRNQPSNSSPSRQ